MSKRSNNNVDRRRLRRAEKDSDATRDIMLGRACRRCWGTGAPKGKADRRAS